eukprot:357369-Chlamydomonas_euryale.AAC.2
MRGRLLFCWSLHRQQQLRGCHRCEVDFGVCSRSWRLHATTLTRPGFWKCLNPSQIARHKIHGFIHEIQIQIQDTSPSAWYEIWIQVRAYPSDRGGLQWSSLACSWLVNCQPATGTQLTSQLDCEHKCRTDPRPAGPAPGPTRPHSPCPSAFGFGQLIDGQARFVVLFQQECTCPSYPTQRSKQAYKHTHRDVNAAAGYNNPSAVVYVAAGYNNPSAVVYVAVVHMAVANDAVVYISVANNAALHIAVVNVAVVYVAAVCKNPSAVLYVAAVCNNPSAVVYVAAVCNNPSAVVHVAVVYNKA